MFYKETNFKETPIGKIPKDWEVVRFGNIATFIKGRKPAKISEEYKEGYLPYLSTEYLRVNEKPKFAEVSRDVVLVDQGELILLWDGSNAGEFFIGKKGILSSTMVKIQFTTNKVFQPFFFYLLKTKERYLSELTRGTGIPHVDKNVVNNLLFQFPPFLEQQKIAEILSTIDEAIQKTNEIIIKTERLKKGLMQELLTKGIGHKEFKDTEIGRIPKEWKVIKIDEIFDIRVGGDLSRLNFLKERNEKYKFPIYSNSVENNGLYGYADTYQYPEKCITVTARGTLGYAIPRFEKFNAIIRLLVLVPKKELDIIFMSEYINSKIKFRLEKTSIPQLTAPKIAKYKVPLPPIEEQHKIAEIFSTLNKKLEIERNEKEKLERSKQGLMDLLLTGKIRVKVG